MTDLGIRMAAEIKTGPNILARLQQGPRLEQYYELHGTDKAKRNVRGVSKK